MGSSTLGAGASSAASSRASWRSSGRVRLAVDRGYESVRDRRSGFHLGLSERLVAPALPGIVAIDMQQKFRRWAPIGVKKADGRADAVVSGFPGAQVVIDALRFPELLLEQRPDRLQARRRPHPRVQPREVPAGHDQFGKQFLALHQPPHPLAIVHQDKCSPDDTGVYVLPTERATCGNSGRT